jgi:membrane fusion protein (multidrug efflux system)
VATADASSKALRPRRTDLRPREFIAVPVPRGERLHVSTELVQASPRRRYITWMIACAVLALVATPIALWLHHQSEYVMSRNAMVRGQLAQLGARFEGVVTSIEVEQGERVSAGQILARLEDRHIRADAQQAQAELEGLKRELEVERTAIIHEERRLQNRLREATANLNAAAAAVEAAQSRAEDARAAHDVRRSLLESGFVSRESARDAEAKSTTADALVRGARAEREAARAAAQRARIDAAGLAIRKQRIGVLEAGVMRAEARLSAAQANLEATLIRAPADGAVVRRIVQPGGSVEVGSPILSLWIGKDVWVEAWLDEDDIGEVKIGAAARVTLQSFPGREFTGTVDKIGLTTDYEMPASEVPQPRSVRMRGAPVVGVGIRLENPPPVLLPGLSAIVAIRRPQS